MRYEQFKLAMERETRSVKAVEEPRTMRERRQDMVVVMRMALIGSEVRGSTCLDTRLVSATLRVSCLNDRVEA